MTAPEILRDALLDRDNLRKHLSLSFQRHNEESKITADKSSPDFEKFYHHWFETNLLGAVDLVFDNAGSEIEKIFLGSLLMGFAMNDPLGITFHPPNADAPALIARHRESFATIRKMRTHFKKSDPKHSMRQYLDWLKSEKTIDENEAEHWKMMEIMEPMIGRSYHIMPQAGFPGALPNGKKIRSDIAIWVPNCKKINVVVECDGYEWHSDKSTFTSDRQRDRALKRLGFDVLRFSGSEIFKDPVQVYVDLTDDLDKRRGKRWAA